MNAKLLLRNLVQRLVATEWIWTACAPFVRMAESLRFWRERHRVAVAAGHLFQAGRVLHGPFAGLSYAGVTSSGGSPYPRLVGSHESELHPWIESIRGRGYTRIIDVGSAEGYYVAGLARLFPEAEVIGYDIDAAAQAECRRMAEANGVAERVEVRGECTPQELASAIQGVRCLVICDCEGHEAAILTREVAEAGRQTDFLVEVHDFTSTVIDDTLRSAFTATHRITRVASISASRKAAHWHRDWLPDVPPDLRHALFDEHRAMEMHWLIMEPLETAASRGVS